MCLRMHYVFICYAFITFCLYIYKFKWTHLAVHLLALVFIISLLLFILLSIYRACAHTQKERERDHFDESTSSIIYSFAIHNTIHIHTAGAASTAVKSFVENEKNMKRKKSAKEVEKKNKKKIHLLL